MLIFLFGPDNFRMRLKAEEIIKAYQDKHQSGLNLTKFYFERSPDWLGIKRAINTASMFAEKKLIIFYSLSARANSGQQEDFLAFIRNNKLDKDQDRVLLFMEPENFDAEKPLAKYLLAKANMSQEFKPLFWGQKRAWLNKRINKLGAGIHPSAAELLLQFVGSDADLWRLNNELLKLANYDNFIAEPAVRLLVKPRIQTDVFQTIEAVASQDGKKALKLVLEHLARGEEALYIFSRFVWQFRSMLMLKDLQEQRVGMTAWASLTGLHPFVVKKASYHLPKFKLEQLKNTYFLLQKIDAWFKSGKITPELGLSLFVYQAANS